MRIGIVTTWFERGAAYVSRAYLETLSTRHNVFVYARGGEFKGIGDSNWDIPNVRWAKSKNYIIDRDDFELWLHSNQIELVIFNEQEHWWPPVLWAREAGLKTVAYVDYYTKRMIRWFSLYDALWCNTKRHYSVFNWHPGALFIRWGTNLKLFQPKRHKNNGDLIFFHSAGMGGVNLRKGTDILVKAFIRVKGAAQLIIHSQVPIEKFGDEIVELVNTDQRIRFIHKTVPAPGLYNLGDIYVYPSRLEGLGLSIPEALACGLPVICTDVPPCNEFVINGINGWCVPANKIGYRKDRYYWPETECSVFDLADQMQYCVDERHLLSIWRDQARNFAETNLDWTKNSEVLLDEIDAIINSPTKSIPRLVKWDIENYFSISPSLIWRLYWRLAYSN